VIERPPNRKYMITDEEIWDIVVNAEKQGGNKTMALKINRILEEVVRRHDAR
jgi:hypothetical protein